MLSPSASTTIMDGYNIIIALLLLRYQLAYEGAMPKLDHSSVQTESTSNRYVPLPATLLLQYMYVELEAAQRRTCSLLLRTYNIQLFFRTEQFVSSKQAARQAAEFENSGRSSKFGRAPSQRQMAGCLSRMHVSDAYLYLLSVTSVTCVTARRVRYYVALM